jgi:uncharacterized protein YjdB
MDIAIPATMDTEIKGTYNTNGQVIYYSFTAPVTGIYDIKDVGNDKASYFNVYNNEKTALADVNNTTNKQSRNLTINLTAGTQYFLSRGEYSSLTTPGADDAKFTFTIATPYNEGGKGANFDLAITAAMDKNIKGSYKTNGQALFYTFKAPRTGNYTIKDVGNDKASYFTVYSSAKTAMEAKKFKELTIRLTAGQTYYIERGEYSSLTTPGAADAKFTFSISTPPIVASSVKLNKTSISVKRGKKATLKVTITPKNASNKKLTWTSNKKAIATVSSKGVVTGKKKGKATITVKTSNGKTAKCNVRVR